MRPADPKTVPGGAPISAEERARLDALFDAACEAEETFGVDELERYVEERAREERTDPPRPCAPPR